MKNFKFYFVTLIFLYSCKSSDQKQKSVTQKSESKKISKQHMVQNNNTKKTYPQVDLPDNISDSPKLDDQPNTIAKKKKSYVYYKPVSIKPSEKKEKNTEKMIQNDSLKIIYQEKLPPKPSKKYPVKFPKNKKITMSSKHLILK